MTRRDFAARAALAAGSASITAAAAQQTDAVNIGTRRELFVDREMIAETRGSADLRLGTLVDAGAALELNRPWEGRFCGYTTLIADGGRFRMYYRGVPDSGNDGNNAEVTCVAESADGVHWSRPDLRLLEVRGAAVNNVILAGQPPFSHNFTPFIDLRPGIPEAQRYKALGGVHKSGLAGFVSPDGLAWKRIQDAPVLPSPKAFAFDSQNIAFWSTHEKKYVCYFRTWKKFEGAAGGGYRWVSRAVSDDFLNWTIEGEMNYGGAPPEHLYTNQTSSYFRAPHMYIGICARFMPGRQVLNAEQAAAVGVDPGYFKDCSDAVLVSSRGARDYRRAFMEAFVRPGVGLQNWVSRSNYPALNLIQTGHATMSLFVNRSYGQPSAHLQRYELRLDGLASAHAGYAGGEIVTRPFIFEGRRLELNYATSAAGGIRVEIQDANRAAIPGFTAANDARELIGDEIVRTYAWKDGEDVSALQGRVVRLRFQLKDADLYSFRFAG
jgi:hypothetical protein